MGYQFQMQVWFYVVIMNLTITVFVNGYISTFFDLAGVVKS